MGKRLLFVDDEPDILEPVTFRFRKMGYDVLTAVNGREALDIAKEKLPDLILLDLLLPVMSGYEVCKAIKSDDRLKAIPVILFTASFVHDIEQKVKELGADDYITKPFEPEELVKKIKKLVDQRKEPSDG